MSLYTLRGQLRESEQAIWQIYSQMGYRALELLNQGAVTDAKLSDLSRQLGSSPGPHRAAQTRDRGDRAEDGAADAGRSRVERGCLLADAISHPNPPQTPPDPAAEGVYDVE